MPVLFLFVLPNREVAEAGGGLSGMHRDGTKSVPGDHERQALRYRLYRRGYAYCTECRRTGCGAAGGGKISADGADQRVYGGSGTAGQHHRGQAARDEKTCGEPDLGESADF